MKLTSNSTAERRPATLVGVDDDVVDGGGFRRELTVEPISGRYGSDRRSAQPARCRGLTARAIRSACGASIALAGIGVTLRGSATAFRRAASCPRFAPPELLFEHAQPQVSSDVWSIAATLYFLLTLELPRDEYARQSRLEAARDNPVVSIAMRRPDLPPRLARCIDAALSSEAHARPRDAGHLLDQLMQVDTPELDDIAASC